MWRKLALDTIAQIRAPETQHVFEAALHDADPNIVITSVEYIGDCQCKHLKCQIEELLEGATEPMLVTALLETLCAIGDEASLKLVLRRFSPIEQVPEFQLYSLVKLLGELGGSEHVELLCSILNTRGPNAYQQFLDAITRIRERHPDASRSASVLAVLQKHMNQDMTSLQCNQTLKLLRPFCLEPDVAPVWQGALALQRLKRPEIRRPLEAFHSLKI